MSAAGEVNFRSYCTEYRRTFKWSIDNFSKLPTDWTESSSEFIVEPQSKWHVELRLQEWELLLYLHWNCETRFKNTIQIIISNSNKIVFFSDEWSYEDCLTNMLEYFNSASLMAKLPNDQLILTISISVWFFQSGTQTTSQDPEVQQCYLRNLRSNFRNIFSSEIKPDLTLHVEGGTLRAHKAILMARSEVFAGMFQSGLKEEETDTVNIEDINLAAMKALLQFIYSAEVDDLDLDTAFDVYVAADKYAVLDLKNHSSRVIASKVTVETAADVLVFAKTHDDAILEDDAMRYIALPYQSKEYEDRKSKPLK